MKHSRLLIPTVLFILTLCTTLISGSFMAGVNPFKSLTGFVSGLPFSISLLSILLTHEMGHFIASKRHGILTTFPYFIPGPPIPPLPGTFGAFIKMKSPVVHKKSLLDVGAAGPLAGFVVSAIVTIIGIRFSKVLPKQGILTEELGSSLLFDFLAYITIGSIPDGYDLFIGPVAYAGWIGFFVTSINLLPIGQLDGGHILYAVAGRWHRFISTVFVMVLVVMGLLAYEGWLVWAVLITIVGTKHPPVIDANTPLTRSRKIIMIVTLIVFILTFIPAPFKM